MAIMFMFSAAVAGSAFMIPKRGRLAWSTYRFRSCSQNLCSCTYIHTYVARSVWFVEIEFVDYDVIKYRLKFYG